MKMSLVFDWFVASKLPKFRDLPIFFNRNISCQFSYIYFFWENKLLIVILCDVRFMPCPFTSRKMFCAGSNFLRQPKNLTVFSASSKPFCAGTKTNFTECKSSFCLSQNVCDCHNTQINFLSGTKNLDWPKTFWNL